MTSTPPIRAAILVEGGFVRKWQADALKRCVAGGRLEIVAVLECPKGRPRRRLLKHFGYYFVRALFLHPDANTAVPLSDIVGESVRRIFFEPVDEGSWQRVPKDLCITLSNIHLDVVIKYGMGLIRDPDAIPTKYGILSYHHGDPTVYRGRPAGFYELLDDAEYIGAGVQRLSNVLDGGVFLASGKFRIERHSYRATLQSVYSGSAYLLEKAIIQLARGAAAAHPTTLGKNHRLPDNTTVIKFFGKLLYRKIGRIYYGLFFRKQWKIYFAPDIRPGAMGNDVVLDAPPLIGPDAASFVADPFFLDKAGQRFLCECVGKDGGPGQIRRFDLDRPDVAHPFPISDRHTSYPYTFNHAGRRYVFPEVASWSGPLLYEIGDEHLLPIGPVPLRGLENERLVDPSVIHRDGTFFLFATPASKLRNLDTLRLWTSPAISGPYSEHPESPVKIDPRGARSGGRVFEIGERVFRVGQVNARHYGDGLTVYEILSMDRERYSDAAVGSVRLSDARGPHTIDFGDRGAILDGYNDVFDPLAWLHRLRSRH